MLRIVEPKSSSSFYATDRIRDNPNTGYYILIPWTLDDEWFSVEEIPVRGWIQQGDTYPFDGNEVEHFDLEGSIGPPSSSVWYGFRTFRAKWSRWEYELAAIPIGTEVARDDLDVYLYKQVFDYGNGSQVVVIFVYNDYWDPHPSSGVFNTTNGSAYCVLFENGIPKKYGVYTPTITVFSKYKNPGMSREKRMQRIRHQVDTFFGEKPAIYQALPTRRYNLIPDHVIVDRERLGLRAKHFVKRESWHNMCREFVRNSISPDVKARIAHSLVDGQRRYDGNAINWVSKLTSWGGEISAYLSLIGDLSDPKQWASMWLSTRFGSRLEWGTSMDILDAIWDELLTIRIEGKYAGYQVSRAKTTIPTSRGDIEYHTRLVCADQSTTNLMSAVKAAMDWGYWPSLRNMFDLIPLSFVLDWFTNVSVVLDNIDDMVYRKYLKVALFEESVKVSLPVNLLLGDELDSNDVYIKYYHRWGSTVLPEFGILEGYDPRLPSLINIIDGASLLVQFSS